MAKGNPKPKPRPKAPRKSRAKQNVEDAESSSDIDVVAAPPVRAPRTQVNWAKNDHFTDKLVEKLAIDPVFRKKLFSDSSKDAKKDGRDKHVAKDGKSVQYGVLARFIFKEDPVEGPRYVNEPTKYAGAVETRLRRLKTEYQACLVRIGSTGAGLDPSRVTAGTALSSLIDEVRNDFPWWDDLHSFWRELPNYNTVGVQSSEPGTDHASAAAEL
ncbi:hypothetical protein C8R46DRAFT_973851, partial [Mycena filopes]